MPNPWRTATPLVVAVVALLGACDEAQVTTEVFEGTVARQSSSTHTIATVAEGEATATLISTDPVVAVGLGIGQPSASGGSCSFQVSNGNARVGGTVSMPVEPGTYCVSVYDGGSLPSSVAYSIAVTHP